MAIDRHVGRQNPQFVSADPEKQIQLIRAHGVLARIIKARICACIESDGSPDILCTVCKGKGFLYTYQQKLLQVDEDSDQNNTGNEIYPLRVPVLEPLYVDRLLSDIQGGIKRYTIDSYNSETIYISGDDLPQQHETKRVSYYFDRFIYIENDPVIVDSQNKILTATQTKFDGQYKNGNIFNVHGDIQRILRIYNEVTGEEFNDYEFSRNQVYVKTESNLENIRMDYYYCPPAKILATDIETESDNFEKWGAAFVEGKCRITLEPWYEVGTGDLITLLTPMLYKNEIIKHNSDTKIDTLFELDIFEIDDFIIDKNGQRYTEGTDFVLKHSNQLHWIGNEPGMGDQISVRYGYHPTFIVFKDNPVPNTLEDKIFPKIIMAHYWSKTKQSDVQKLY